MERDGRGAMASRDPSTGPFSGCLVSASLTTTEHPLNQAGQRGVRIWARASSRSPQYALRSALSSRLVSLRWDTVTELLASPFPVSQTSTEVSSSQVIRTDLSGVALRMVSLTPG